MMNMHWGPLDFALARISGRRWVRAIDTALPCPLDIAEPGTEQPIDASSYLVSDRSIAVLLSRPV
jgi:hypothetical protein